MTNMFLIFVSALLLIMFLICVFLAIKDVRRKIQSQKEEENEQKAKQSDLLKYFIHQVEIAESLNELFILHIKIWANGIQHPNFGPCKYGMFRTKDILTMNKEEVFLGNVQGLFTLPLSKWECIEDEDSKLIVFNQYRTHLIVNLKALQNNE